MPKEQPLTVETVREKLTEDRRRHIGAKLAETVQSMIDNKNAKTAATADFTARHKSLEKEIIEFTDILNRNYEEVQVQTMARFHTPSTGMKEVFRADSGETLRTERMTATEMQDALPFEESDSGLVSAPRKGKRNAPPTN